MCIYCWGCYIFACETLLAYKPDNGEPYEKFNSNSYVVYLCHAWNENNL